MNAWRICGWTAGMLIMLLAVAGCMSGGSSLTDGSLPIGDVDGVALLATRADSVADISVELVKPSGEVAATVQTNEMGAFAFHGVPQGRWRVRARLATRAGDVDFDMITGDTVVVVLQLVEYDSTVQAVHLTPSVTQHIAVGDQVAFSAEGVDADENPIANLPVCWAVQGHIGTITPGGFFQATRAGSGVVVAQYGDLRATVQVIVSPAAGPGPN